MSGVAYRVHRQVQVLLKAAHPSCAFDSLRHGRGKEVVVRPSLAALRLQPVNSPLLFGFALGRMKTLQSNTFKSGVQLERLLQKTLLKRLLNVNFITSCYSSIVTFGDSIHTSAPCRTIHCGLIACLACDAQCPSLAEAPALWHSPRADFTLTWQEPGHCGSFQRSCGRHGGF